MLLHLLALSEVLVKKLPILLEVFVRKDNALLKKIREH